MNGCAADVPSTPEIAPVPSDMPRPEPAEDGFGASCERCGPAGCAGGWRRHGWGKPRPLGLRDGRPVLGLIVPIGDATLSPEMQEALDAIDGVDARVIDEGEPSVLVRYVDGSCPVDRVVAAIERVGGVVDLAGGRHVEPASVELRVTATPRERGRRARAWDLVSGSWAMRLVAIGGLLLVTGAVLGWTDISPLVVVPLLVASAVLSSTRTFPEAVESIRELRVNVDVLMFVAAVGAAALGHWAEGAFLLFLFGLGAAGEELAMEHAERSVASLADLAPDTAAIARADGRVDDVPLDDIVIGDEMLVRPFDRIGLDGEVIEGSSAVNEAAITGESVPVEKSTGSRVLAGTMNAGGSLRVRVTATASESTLSRIMDLVADAQASRSPAELFTEKVERVYVPMVFVMTAAVLAGPPLLAGGAWGEWFYRSMAFMTAASPCALAIGTPAAVLCALSRSAQLGVLIKGGGHLETLARVRTMAMDKTGTLTEGVPKVTAIACSPGQTEDQVLALAAAVESGISHPLAEAIVGAARARGLALADADDVEQLLGSGVRGVVGGRAVRVTGEISGNDDDVARTASAWQDDGASVAVLEVDGTIAGAVRLEDAPRERARAAIERLSAIGVGRVVMLTGDHEAAAARVADAVGVGEVHASLKPDNKLRHIDDLRRDGSIVAMVGDGVNDAPALAKASIGIAMGAAGSDAAMETADAALMGSQLDRLPDAIMLARSARRLIAQNMVIALGVIAIVAPMAALGHAPLGVAVLLHEGSTIVVVLNALRLLRWRST